MAILLIAILLRVWMIEIKPPHFDEGVNGWFADQMAATGFYKYDPNNYHGPLHFYAVFLCQTLFGRHLWAIRIPSILAGVFCVWAALLFRPWFGRAATWFAAGAIAVSPGYVFYSRYSIHESWQVFFSMLFLWGLLGLWQSGTRQHLAAVLLAATGMILTKETYLLHIGCFAIAAGVLAGWQRIVPSRPTFPLSAQRWTYDDLIAYSGLAILLIIFFYSGTFLCFPALRGLFQTFHAWFKTGVDAAGHDKPLYSLVVPVHSCWQWLMTRLGCPNAAGELPVSTPVLGALNYYWVFLMAQYELPALLGLVACARYIFPSDARLRYIAIAVGGTLLAYSIIPYKTPWCIISIIWPFYFLLAGLLREGFEFTLSRFPRMAQIGFPLGALVLLGFSLAQSLKLNFHHFTDEKEPYVYVQTFAGIYTFTEPLTSQAEKNPSFYHKKGLILMDSYYPLPWMLGNFTSIGYYKKDMTPADWNVDFIAAESDRESAVDQHLTKPFFKRRFKLRDSQGDCVAYFAADVFGELFKSRPDIVPMPSPAPEPPAP